MQKLLVLLALVGCSSSKPSMTVEQAIAAVEPKVAPRFALLEAATKAPPKDAKPFSGKYSILDYRGGDTLLVYAADIPALAANKAPPYIRGRHLDGSRLPECWVAVRQKQTASFPLRGHSLGEAELAPVAPHVVASACKPVLDATYAAIVGVTELEGTDAKADTYTRGKTVGVIDLYNLTDGTFLGRKTFAAAAAASLTYKTDSTGAGAEMDLAAAADENLQRQTQIEIEKALLGV